MKKMLLLLTFGFCLQNAYAQLPSFADNPVWNMIDYSDFIIQLAFDYNLKYSEETTICNNKYGVIKQKGKSYYLRNEGNKTYIRLDTDCSKKERLLYDFDMKVGDTTWVQANSNFTKDSMKIVLKSITKVKYNNVEQNQFNLDYYYQYDKIGKKGALKWISNISSPDGPLYFLSTWPQLVDGGSFVLACLNKNGDIIYKNPQYPNCGKVAQNDVNDIENTVISPNPFNNNISIKSELATEKTVEVFDYQGIIVLKNTYATDLNLNTEQLKSGIYFIKIKSANGGERVYKVLKME